MWRACVWSSMSYALHNIHLTPAHVKRIQTVVMKHVRAITVNPAHISRISDSDLMNFFGMSMPLNLITQQVFQAYQNVHQRPEAHSTDVLPWLRSLTDRFQDLQALLHAPDPEADMPDRRDLPQTEPAADPEWTCSTCCKTFKTFKSLKIHQRKAHQKHRNRMNSFPVNMPLVVFLNASSVPRSSRLGRS